MTDLNRNTRTLIVSFAIAIMALVPLRFIEVGNMMKEYNYVGQNQAMVLGEQTQREEVVLPETRETVESQVRLEAPYDEIDGVVLGVNQDLGMGVPSCYSRMEIGQMEDSILAAIDQGEIYQAEAHELLNQVGQMRLSQCN
jgi:hypothetical protein